jgi:bifunctional non-homologous end joining protein LigD
MIEPNTEFLFTRQRHEALRAGVHYDVRLVYGDKAYSWATRKETPEPGKMIVLFEQPVHDASYALSQNIEIPKGQYGGGTTNLVEVMKAKIHPDSRDDHIKFSTSDGRSFLLKKMSSDKYGEKAWMFLNLGNKYLEKVKNELGYHVE